tara:strand:+ start:3133 stop:4323 length:1191 start_codon:yes stop_codon:yes gene_type:complete
MRAFFYQYDNLIYTALAIFGAASIFLFSTLFGDVELIGLFAFNSVIIFLLMHCFTIGIDAFILSNLKSDLLPFNKQYFVPLLLFVLTVISSQFVAPALSLFQPFDYIQNNYNVGINLQFTLIAFGALLGAYSKIMFAAIMLWTKNSHDANKLYLLKALGLNLSFLCYVVTKSHYTLIFAPLFVEVFTFVTTLYFVAIHKRGIVKRKFQMSFLLSSLNVFGFDAIMKMDLLILSIFAGPKVLSVYALYSAVVEGYVQIFASFKYKSSLAIIKRDNWQVNNIIKNGFVLSLSFIPALIIFLFVIGQGNQFMSEGLIYLLSLAVIASVPGIVLYNLFELRGCPEKTFTLSLIALMINLCFGYFLYPVWSTNAVAMGTLMSYLFLSVFNFYFWKKYKCAV